MTSLRLRSSAWLGAIARACALVASGCGGGDGRAIPADTPDTATTNDAASDGGDTRPESGPPSDTYPAFVPGTPTVINRGGHVMTAPEITTVTWAGEPNADTFESLGDQVGASAYWRSITAEYGIGPATSGAGHHVRLAEATPTDVTFAGLKIFVAGQLADLAKSKWPAPTEDSQYVLYLPACPAEGAYHNWVTVGSIQVPYAIVGACPVETPTEKLSMRDSMTVVASHEIGEAATDPLVGNKPGYAGYDEGSLAWAFWGGGLRLETADVCQFLSNEIITGPPDLPFRIARQWSNKSAKASLDPCVPAPESPYFNVVAFDLEDVTQAPATFKSKGFVVPVGTSKDLGLGFFSSAPRPNWSVSVAVGNPVLKTLQDPGIEAVFVGPTTGNNGTKTVLHVSVTKPGVTLGDAHLLTVTSTRAGLVNHYPLFITGH